MISQQVNKCLIRDSAEIRTAINKRLRQFDITSRELVAWSKDNGKTFDESQLSRYRKHGNVKGSLQAADVIWLCETLKIHVGLKVINKKFKKNPYLIRMVRSSK